MMNNKHKAALVALAAAMMAVSFMACGLETDKNEEGGNTAPVALAGADRAVQVAETVMLNGGGSHDADAGDALSYSWSLTQKPAASGAVLAGANTATPSFMADVHGTYVVDLVVSDGTVSSAPDSVTVRTMIEYAISYQSVTGAMSGMTQRGQVSVEPFAMSGRFDYKSKNGTAVSPGGWDLTVASTPNADGSVQRTITRTIDATAYAYKDVDSADGLVRLRNRTRSSVNGSPSIPLPAHQVFIRRTPYISHTNAMLSGSYYLLAYGFTNSASAWSGSGTFTADGAGALDLTLAINDGGVINTVSGTKNYSISAGGIITVTDPAKPYDLDEGYLGTNQTFGFLLSMDNTYDIWNVFYFMKKADKAYTQADATGNWAITGMSDSVPAGVPSYAAIFGHMNCNASGACTITYLENADGVLTTNNTDNAIQITMNADGSFPVNGEQKAGAMGDGGGAMFFNYSFDAANPNTRGFFIAVKCPACTSGLGM